MVEASDALSDIPRYRPDLIAGLYRPMRQGDWELRCGGDVLMRGYWSPPHLVSGIIALLRRGETWMSITPMEIESQETGIAHARGHVVVFGLGLGWAAAASALRCEVDRITVIERDPEVIALHQALALFSSLPDQTGDKINIVEGDALAWVPDEPVDLLMADIWLPLVSAGRIDEVRQMQNNVGADRLYFWGQEMEIARHIRAAGLRMDDAGMRTVAESLGLPLVGPDDPGYAERTAAAAAAWLKDQ